MRFLLGVVVLAAACSGGEPAKDTSGDFPPALVGDERASAMRGAAVPDSVMDRAVSTDPRARILVVGTSLTAGLGLDPTNAYPAVLQRMADSAGYAVRIVNAGLSGETSAGALRRLEWLLREPAAIVMVESGANDGLRGVDIDSTRANLVAIIRTVKAALPGAPVLLLQMEAPPNLGPQYTRRFRENYSAVARSEGVALMPFLLEGVAGVRALNQGDGIHPTAEGAKRVARTLWPFLAPHLERLRDSS